MNQGIRLETEDGRIFYVTSEEHLDPQRPSEALNFTCTQCGEIYTDVENSEEVVLIEDGAPEGTGVRYHLGVAPSKPSVKPVKTPA